MGLNRKSEDAFDKARFWIEEVLTALLPGLVLFGAVAFGVGG